MRRCLPGSRGSKVSAPHCCCSWGGCNPSEDADGTLAHLCLPESLCHPFSQALLLKGPLKMKQGEMTSRCLRRLRSKPVMPEMRGCCSAPISLPGGRHIWAEWVLLTSPNPLQAADQRGVASPCMMDGIEELRGGQVPLPTQPDLSDPFNSIDRKLLLMSLRPAYGSTEECPGPGAFSSTQVGLPCWGGKVPRRGSPDTTFLLCPLQARPEGCCCEPRLALRACLQLIASPWSPIKQKHAQDDTVVLGDSHP